MAIYHQDIADIELNSGSIFRNFLKHSIGLGDAAANRFGVRVFRDGDAETLSGVSCQGFFRNANGENIALTSYGTVSGNEAYVTLPQACYTVEGRFTLAIKLVGGGVTGTMRIIDGVVDNTNTGSPVAPTGSVPTYQEILSVYDQMVAAKAGSVRFDTEQTLTAAQMTKARGNIEAASESDVSDLKSAVDVIEHSLELVEPTNKYNETTATIGLLNIQTGNVNTSATNGTTSDYIEIEPGDVVTLCAIGANNNYLHGSGSINAICWYDAWKNFISGTGSVNEYEITNQSARYIRVCYINTGAFGTAQIISVTLNYLPATVAEITEYFDPYYKNAYEYAESIAETVDELGVEVQNVTSAVETMQTDVVQIDEAARKKVESSNVCDPDGIEIGLLGSSSGAVTSSATGYSTTGFIECNTGDIIYMSGISATDTYLYGSGTIAIICEYNAQKQYLNTYSNSTNGYTVQSSNAKFIRFSYVNTGAFGTAKILSVTIGFLPSSVSEIDTYFEPYYQTAYDLAEQALAASGGGVDAKIIDCWGDSRTEMVYDTHTAFSDYLQTYLGTGYCVTNHGRSSQASGMVAARMGSNQIFVTVENNRILASGNTHITNIYCTSGLINNFFCFSSNAPIPCVLHGVEGAIYKTTYNNYTTCYFVRKTDGDIVSCPPNELAIVPDFGSKNHAVIMWWGKNDMLTAADGRGAVASVYADAVKWLGHDKFLILGETCSLDSNYNPGATIRTWLDNFNTQMATRYPDNFIDINAWLSSTEALASVDLTPTEADLACIEKGWPCESLMVYSTDTSDPTHPNAKGREAIAKRIYTWMQDHGWTN